MDGTSVASWYYLTTMSRYLIIAKAHLEYNRLKNPDNWHPWLKTIVIEEVLHFDGCQ